ncbi:MAG TPA: hypothetical protein VGD74_12925 [Vulgatibacter sp.]
MRPLRALADWLRRRRQEGGSGRAKNVRVSSSAQREILGGLHLGAPRSQEIYRLWRVFLWAALALVAYQVQAGLLVHARPGLVRVDAVTLLVTFFVLRLGAIEGALAAFAVGYVADLFLQGPPGLCRFLAVAVWNAGRIVAPRAGLSSKAGRVVYAFGTSALFQLGVLGGLMLVSQPGGGPGRIAWLSIVPQALVAAALVLPAHTALGALDRRTSPARA